MSLNPKQRMIVGELQRVAAKLGRAPSRDEYFRGGKRENSAVTEHQIKKEFGSWEAALASAGVKLNSKVPLTDKAGLKVAQLTEELAQVRGYVNELEDEVLNSEKLRKLIGSVDTSELGEGSDWTKGAKRLLSAMTGIPVLFLSDIHFDEVVKPEQIGHTNVFNRDVATKRLQFTFLTAVRLLKRVIAAPKYEGIVLALGGDLLSGNIHEELAETNEAAVNQSLFALLDVLVTGINLLADEFGKVFVPCVVGNHGRYHRKPRMKNRVYDNFEWLIYQFLVRHFRGDPRVSFFIPDGPDAYFNVYGKRICLTHGDQFQGGTGIAGIFSPLMLGMARKQRRQQAMQQPFDLMMMGHWHQLLMMETLIVNGSVKGYDEFAYTLNLPFEKPQQACFVVHPERGITYRMPIICNGYEKQNRPSGPSLSW